MGVRFRLLVVAMAILVGLAAARAGQSGATRRLTPSDIADLARSGPGAGTSGVAGIQTTILSGDPTGSGLYTIRLNVPANIRIEAHTHRDDRSATVISGTWYLGYGPRFDDKALKALPAGSFYTEPQSQPHFAQTRAEPVVLHITGRGPTDTAYVDRALDPRAK